MGIFICYFIYSKLMNIYPGDLAYLANYPYTTDTIPFALSPSTGSGQALSQGRFLARKSPHTHAVFLHPASL
jgi:hypothetical protein